MPKDESTGLVEPDLIVNGRALTFAECMSVRVAVGNMRIMLQDAEHRRGIGEQLATNYDHHLARVEQTMLTTSRAGATGQFPFGSSGRPDDLGELRAELTLDRAQGRIRLFFGKPVIWLDMVAGQARAFAAELLAKADALDRTKV